MASLDLAAVAFDMYGTLVHNDQHQWAATFVAIAGEQHLPIAADRLHLAWSAREVAFRKTRTDMRQPEASLPFRSYWEAWRDAFTETFAALDLDGDAEVAATRCADGHALREPFAEVPAALAALASRWRLGVLSNADDRFLHGLIARQGWRFGTVLSSEGARAYKPDPRIFAAFCGQAGVSPEQVLYVGDSPYDDVHGAKLAGMHTVLVRRDQQTPGRTPPPDSGALLSADFEIDSLAQLEPLLAREARSV